MNTNKCWHSCQKNDRLLSLTLVYGHASCKVFSVFSQVFFYKAQLQAGSVSPNEDITDFVWVTKNELKDYVPKAYLRKVNQFVLEL